MGAVVAFELARHLRTQGFAEPLCLFASGCPAPQRFAVMRKVHDLSDSEFLERLRDLNATPEWVMENAELREILLPVLRADFQVCETYEYLPEDPVRWPIYVFGGATDPEVPLADLDSWREQTLGEFRRKLYPGGHFFLHEHWPDMLDVVRFQLGHLGREWQGRPAASG
jgi:medium-chain acyl-[acyl-carrier-protein] hydrolase